MAEYEGHARTNYFKVKDLAAFRAWTEPLDLEITTDVDDPDAVALLCNTEHGTWPDIDPETHEEIDFELTLSGHLAPGQVAVLMEVGHEKMCYVGGYATAINDEGKRIDINLCDIYKMAQEKFGVDISAAEY
jgi:hypothetical protein